MMTPQTETELAEMISTAQGSIDVRGGGTRGIVKDGDNLLSTKRISGVSLYEPGALTLVAKAGTPLAELDEILAAEGQRIGFEPGDLRPLLGGDGTPTIGGVMASNTSGPRRIQAGAARDFCLGVRFVDGQGTVLKNGGRVMKNVTGYDLVKLMCGAFGTLGVMTEVSLKVSAIPETEATLQKQCTSDAQAVAFLSAALGSPFDVSGAAIIDGVAMVRIEGLAGSVMYRAAALQSGVLSGFDVVHDGVSAEIWRGVRDVAPFVGHEGAVWRVSVKPSDGPKLVASLASIEPQVVYDWGGGLVWLRVAGEGDACARIIRAEVDKLGGHATLVRASEAVRRSVPMFHPAPAPVAAISQGLRAKFDPHGRLNRGLMET